MTKSFLYREFTQIRKNRWFLAKRYWLTPTEEKMLRVLEEDQSVGFLRG